MAGSIKETGDSVLFDVKASPGASRTEIAAIQEGALRVRVAAAPEDGKANAELRAFLAKALGCPKSAVVLLRGEKSRMKTFQVPSHYREGVEKLFRT